MQGLLVLGCFALGVFLVTASPQDQDQPEVEAKEEGGQGEFVHIREIRSTGDKKRGKPSRRTHGLFTAVGELSLPTIRDNRGEFVHIREIRSTGDKKKGKSSWRTHGLFTALAKLPTTRDKRSTEPKPKRCSGCYTPLVFPKEKKVLSSVSRQQRDADEHKKLKRKHKHLKEKSHMKRRKHKDHEDRHAHFQAEDAEIGHNNQRRRKHHRGKKDKEQHRSGSLTALGRVSPDSENINMDTNGRQRGHRRGKDRSHHRTGSLTALGLAPSEMMQKKMQIDNNDKQDITE